MGVPTGGRVVVTNNGTAVAFPSQPKRCIALKVRARETNTGAVYLGDANVSSTNGWPLLQGTDGINSEIDWPIPEGQSIDLKDLYVDADTNNDLVYFAATLE